MKYSMVIRMRPASGNSALAGRLKLVDRLWSSSIMSSRTQRCTIHMPSTPVTAAMARLVRTSVTLATWPQSAAPAALPPMMAIWYIDMPRARTQSGSASWAATLRVLAVEIQATPPRNITSTAT